MSIYIFICSYIYIAKRDPDENHLEDSLFSESSKKFQKEN